MWRAAFAMAAVHDPNFRELYTERSSENELHYPRCGRGISFHDLFVGPSNSLSDNRLAS